MNPTNGKRQPELPTNSGQKLRKLGKHFFKIFYFFENLDFLKFDYLYENKFLLNPFFYFFKFKKRLKISFFENLNFLNNEKLKISL